MSGEAKRGTWERPHLLSVSIPVVEELLAESYKKKAELWAEAAKRLRENQSPATPTRASAPAGPRGS